MSTLQTYNLKHPDASGNQIVFTSGGDTSVAGSATFTSPIKASKIENASTTDGGVEIDSDGHVQVDGMQLPTTGPLTNRNLIINGEFAVSQRGTTFTYEGTGQSHTVYNSDRFTTQAFGSSFPSGDYLRISQDTDVPSRTLAGTVFKNSQKIEALQAIPVGSGPNAVWTKQSIEGFNSARLGFGSASPSKVTISFWVKATKTGTFSVTLKSSDSNLSYVSTVTIASANTWQKVEKTIAGPTTGTFNTDNTAGLQLIITWAINPGWIATSTFDQWIASNASGSTTQTNFFSAANDAIYITGVQIEEGERATPFEHISYGEELARCQRYYQNYTLSSGNEGVGILRGSFISGASEYARTLPVSMRALPSFAGLSTNTSLTARKVDGSTSTNATVDVNNVTSFTNLPNIDNQFNLIRFRFSPGLTDGEPYLLWNNGQPELVYSASAEL